MFIDTLYLSQHQSYFVQSQTSTSTLDTLSCVSSSSSKEVDSSSDTVAKPTSCLFVICPSSKPITLAWYPSKTIGQVKCELQARLGLLPSHYVLHIMGSKMLSEVSPIILVYLRKVRKHSRSNECLSIWHSITVSRLNRWPKLII